MKKKSKPVVYMLDTNILYDWASTFTPQTYNKDERWRQYELRIKAFCEKNENFIVVPDIVWVEFLSVMLHKKIDVHGDYEETMLHFRDRQSLVQQIEGITRSSDNWNINWEPDANPFPDAEELLRDPKLINRHTFKWMRRSAEYAKKNYIPDMKRLTAKILDGMDSAILVCLNDLASQEENKNKQVVLFTADRALWSILGRIKRRHKTWFAQNTGAVYARFDKVMCQHRQGRGMCRHYNHADILRHKDMLCVNRRGVVSHSLVL